MKELIELMTLVLVATTAIAQSISGSWKGEPNAGLTSVAPCKQTPFRERIS